jgi:ABC-type amino acid transport substrate-binding protein
MKLLSNLFVVLLIVMFPQTQVSAKTVKMAVFMLDPFMMEEAGSKKVVGVTIDYWNSFIAPEMGVDIEVAGIYPILRATQMLRDGEVDVVSQLTKIPDREAEFLYPETPLTSIITCLVVMKDSPLKEVSKSEDLYGMTIGFIKAAYIPEMLKHQKIRLDLITTTDFREMNYNKLQHKIVDAMLDINYVSMKYWLESKGFLDKIRFIMLPVKPMEVYSIFRNTKEGASLRDAFDKANKKGISEKVFEKMTQKYLKQ